MDILPNEVFKNNRSLELPLCLFNFCFNDCVVPSTWRKSLISPIYKGKGKERKDPLSYRPVSLISNPCKIFTFILNNRLLEFLESNDLLVEEHNGFRKNRSCVEHIFVLHSVIRTKLANRKPVYVCFVDFTAAFDFLNRDLMIFALQELGISGNYLEIVKALYSETK